MNTHFQLQMPKFTHYGNGSFKKLGEVLSGYGKHVFIVSDPVMDKLGFVNDAAEMISRCGCTSTFYLGVTSEPTDTYVAEALELLQSVNADVVLAIGGGSCIDTAKAVAVLAANGGTIEQYMGGRKKAERPPLPLIAVPTTAGTGSEATNVTIITDTLRQVKMMIKQPAFMPEAAIIDPLLTLSSPKQITAATGIDALSHAIVAYLSKCAHPMTDMLALSAMKEILPNLQTAYKDGTDQKAREAMALGSFKAGVSFSNASVCLVHGMSRPIGALFHVPHGISNAMLLPAVLEFSREMCAERLADIGRLCTSRSISDTEAADVAIDKIKSICSELNVPNLDSWGIDENLFRKAIPKMAADALESGSPANNPRVPSLKELEELYLTAYTYSFSKETNYASGGDWI